MYTASNWLQPQIYADPNQSAIVTPPNGWGIVPAPGSIIPCPKPRGMGVFDSWDPTTWGLAEWVIIGVGVYFILNVGKGGSGGSGWKRKGRSRRSSARGPSPRNQASEDAGYGPYYKKLSAEDKAKVREYMAS